jgi:hypothetical protein
MKVDIFHWGGGEIQEARCERFEEWNSRYFKETNIVNNEEDDN